MTSALQPSAPREAAATPNQRVSDPLRGASGGITDALYGIYENGRLSL